MPPCDGLPRYSNGSPGGYVEAYAFRSQSLEDCADDLGEELLAAAYQTKVPADTLAYGRQLLAVADDPIHRYNLDPRTLNPDEFPALEERQAGARARRRFGRAGMADRHLLYQSRRGFYDACDRAFGRSRSAIGSGSSNAGRRSS